MNGRRETRRGVCVGCERTFNLRLDGRIVKHGRMMYGCPGSNHPPRNGAALNWLLNHPAVPEAVARHFWHLELGERCTCAGDDRGGLRVSSGVPGVETQTRTGRSEPDDIEENGHG